jgi:hypothetical protein
LGCDWLNQQPDGITQRVRCGEFVFIKAYRRALLRKTWQSFSVRFVAKLLAANPPGPRASNGLIKGALSDVEFFQMASKDSKFTATKEEFR